MLLRPQLASVLLAACALAVAPPARAAESAVPLETVAQVDLTRYAGAWYEIALLPNRFQKQCVADTQARYRLDGNRVEVVNRCRKASGEVERTAGHAKTVEGSGNAKLRVTFFWPFYGNYWVLDLDPDYQQVLVGEPSRKYGWILSRTPQMDEAKLQALLDKAESLGYDKNAFRRTPQTQPLD
ncbi:lipocalin family protein [Kinneretia aquatilis]|uniref:lipocalin family protein n=1 Tax=Kinneretia aquatilis TaxID=2070761 RepID=UPI0014952620|nr:lipocalin family protein [Paucibacter aquatile]WIV98346.1 lipocalin family protein [Paucibacter aquatile]